MNDPKPTSDPGMELAPGPNTGAPTSEHAKGAYVNCRWCGGRGCLACPAERSREENRPKSST
jgi:hypothetical protein